jgi:NADPH-dependent 2,4-dienoyl-CoA reductase/sulfur reductase-like enzyme/nitrite reductase/ring-hydroxylating ferredoxin subunit
MQFEKTEIDGEKALIIRRGDETFTIAATCTHYGGPLEEGIVVGDTIRCPWHHACFDLRTGEAVRAPALAPLKVYAPRHPDAERSEAEGSPPLRSFAVSAAQDDGSIAIIGAGAAGTAAADMLRRRGFAGTIAMFGTEPPVDRPNLSKEYLAGHAPEEWLPLPLPADVDLQTRRVTALDAKTKTLTLDDGTTRAFDAILIATGAEPIRLPIAGADQPHVHVLRTLADSRALVALAEKGRRACIIGAGFIGLEVAASLRAREVDVEVIAPEEIPLARIMGDEVGRFVQRLHEEHGVRFRLGATVKSIDEIAADFVVIGAGVRPNTQLAEAAGLKVDNGIVVDEMLETSAPGIYAAGDVARFPDRFSGRAIRVEHWAVAETQGQTVARNILGARAPHAVSPFFWSAHYDVTINYVGNAAGWERAEVHGSLDERRALVAYRIGERIAAIATIGMDRECLLAEEAMEKNDREELERIVATISV